MSNASQSKPRAKRERQPGAPLTVSEAADALSVSDRTIRRMCKLKQIEHYRAGAKGGVIRIPEHAITAYQSRQVEVTESAPSDHRSKYKHLGRRSSAVETRA